MPPYGLSGLFWDFGMFFIFVGVALGTPFRVEPQLPHLASCGFRFLKCVTTLDPGVLTFTFLSDRDRNALLTIH